MLNQDSPGTKQIPTPHLYIHDVTEAILCVSAYTLDKLNVALSLSLVGAKV